MKIFLSLLLLASTGLSAIPPIATYDREVHIWARQRVVFQTNTVSDAEYVMATEFMRYLNYTGLRPKIKRCGIYLGSGLESCRAPFIADTGTAISTNDTLYNFVEGDYTVNGLTGNASTKYISTSFYWSIFSTTTNIHLAVYSRTSGASNGTYLVMGMSDVTLGATHVILSASSLTYIQMGAGTYNTGSDSDALGFAVHTRTAANASAAYKNGSLLVADTGTATSIPPETLNVHARNAGGTTDSYTSRQLCFYSAGLGISAADDTAYYRGVQRLQTRRGRAL